MRRYTRLARVCFPLLMLGMERLIVLWLIIKATTEILKRILDQETRALLNCGRKVEATINCRRLNCRPITTTISRK